MGYVIRDATIIDGLGGPRTVGDVVVEGDRIHSVGSAQPAGGRTEVDGAGLALMPGFVDMHSHSDVDLIRDPSAEPKVLQGVTLEVLGQDGLSYAPSAGAVHQRLSRQLRAWNGGTCDVEWPFDTVEGYLGAFTGRTAVNVAYLAPHGTLRLMAMADPTSPATSTETRRMEDLLRAALTQGAVGMSAGLMYFPGQFAPDDELAELCELVRDHGGYFAPHHRNYGSRALESYEDVLAVGERSGCAIHLTHANMSFPVNRGRGSELLALVDRYEARGVDITLDSYPYDAGSTSLHELLPSWVKAGGPVDLLRRLGDRTLRARLAEDMDVVGSDSFHGIPVDWSALVIGNVGTAALGRWVGLSVQEGAEALGTTPLDFAADLLVEAELDVGVIAHIGNEENVRRIMQDPRHCVGTDGILQGQRPHPRGWGTFPRFLGRYVRELGLMSLEAAARKLSYVPCQRLGLTDRGLIAEGAKADLVLLDPARVRDTATFAEPRLRPVGVHHVFVNGQPVVWSGQVTGRAPGEPVHRSSMARPLPSHP